jgi:hypothetical protein
VLISVGYETGESAAGGDNVVTLLKSGKVSLSVASRR